VGLSPLEPPKSNAEAEGIGSLMISFLESQSHRAMIAKTEAIGRSQAVIEFKLDGTIITANENFLTTVGYALEEIQGKHHSMFVAPELRDGVDYRAFWTKLSRSEFQAAQYKRIGKGGREIWIQASPERSGRLSRNDGPPNRKGPGTATIRT
jgi:methyl-accepting chemotaxis protein